MRPGDDGEVLVGTALEGGVGPSLAAVRAVMAALNRRVFDAVGKRKASPLRAACEKAVAPGGRYVSVDDGTPELPARDLDVLRNLAETGALRPVIDRTYPLEQVAQAHRYVEGEHKSGNVVITIAHDAE